MQNPRYIWGHGGKKIMIKIFDKKQFETYFNETYLHEMELQKKWFEKYDTLCIDINDNIHNLTILYATMFEIYSTKNDNNMEYYVICNIPHYIKNFDSQFDFVYYPFIIIYENGIVKKYDGEMKTLHENEINKIFETTWNE